RRDARPAASFVAVGRAAASEKSERSFAMDAVLHTRRRRGAQDGLAADAVDAVRAMFRAVV
ncbi:MAG TPA: hypothetical protein VIH40_14220, partial [Xanthobacteraceae bacterium]